MATLLKERSTYWVLSGGSSANSTGDYRCYWKIYYVQSEEDKITHITYFAYLKNEEWEILKYDDNQTINSIADYFINEITQDTNNEHSPRAYMVNIIGNWWFELKDIINSIKIK